MANTFYDITTTKMVGIKDALLSKYGAYNAVSNPTGVEIYYQTSSSVIFKCNRFSDKVIRIFNASQIYGEFGDNWVSGDAVVNPILFGGSNFQSTPNTYHLILCENSIVISCCLTSGTTSARILIVGKLSNNQSIALGCQSSTSFNTGTKGVIIDTSEEFYPVVPTGNLLSNNGEIYKMKLYVSKKIGASVYNSDGTLAYVNDIEVAFYGAGGNNAIIGTDYYITPSGLYMEGTNILRVPNSFIIMVN